MTAARLAAVLLLLGGPLRAQVPDSAEFLAAARRAAGRFDDRGAAQAEGYRRIGPDFPSMGEHWVNIALVAEGALDPARPQILEYIDVGGRPVLAGVAWALPLGGGRRPPEHPVRASAWHYHSGSVDEESFIRGHAEAGAVPAEAAVAVLHVWLGIANPAGVFATDNWALPWARLGLAAPPGVGADASRMLALAAGGERYFTVLARLTGRPDSAAQARIQAALAAGAEQARAAAAAMARDGVTVADVARLAAAWRGLWNGTFQQLDPAVRDRLAHAMLGMAH